MGDKYRKKFGWEKNIDMQIRESEFVKYSSEEG